MNKSEKITLLREKHWQEWSKTRKTVEDEVSQQHPMFCVCGKLATGLHESGCRKFRNKVDTETLKKLKHLLAPPKKKIHLLTDEQYNSPENQNRDNPIVGFIDVK